MARTILKMRITLLVLTTALVAQGMLAGEALPSSPVLADADAHRQPSAQAHMGTPIKQLLNPDGTLNLNAGFSAWFLNAGGKPSNDVGLYRDIP